MAQDWWTDLCEWWATVPAEFAFLLALPFALALAAVFAERPGRAGR